MDTLTKQAQRLEKSAYIRIFILFLLFYPIRLSSIELGAEFSSPWADEIISVLIMLTALPIVLYPFKKYRAPKGGSLRSSPEYFMQSHIIRGGIKAAKIGVFFIAFAVSYGLPYESYTTQLLDTETVEKLDITEPSKLSLFITGLIISSIAAFLLHKEEKTTTKEILAHPLSQNTD